MEKKEDLMTIYRETEAEVVRLAAIEGWSVGTIASRLGVHHSTVTRVLEDAGIKPRDRTHTGTRKRPSMIEPFLGFIKDTFRKYPKLPASVLYHMVCKRGYPGCEDHFRHRIADLSLRPRKPAEAYLELRTLPGEQAQVDWASFGTWPVEGGQRRLSAFVMVLSYSRHIFIRFSLDQKMASFLEGHVQAFSFFGGVAKTILYDNLRSAVLERLGEAKRFNPTLLELATWYRFEPRPVGVRRGNEKGKVERAIRYMRSFISSMKCKDINDLNKQSLEWCTTVAANRGWPEQRSITVRQAFEKERQLLIDLPGDAFPCEEELQARVGKIPYVRFDSNRYSVPHTNVRRTLTLRAAHDRVRIFDGNEMVADHARCWDKQKVVENAGHIEKLREYKRQARLHDSQCRLLRAVPETEPLLMELSNRQRRLHKVVAQLEKLLDTFGAGELSAAVEEALDAGTPDLSDVRLILDRRCHQRNQAPPVSVELPDDPKVRDIVVTPHELGAYDPSEDPDTADEPDPADHGQTEEV